VTVPDFIAINQHIVLFYRIPPAQIRPEQIIISAAQYVKWIISIEKQFWIEDINTYPPGKR
jgi:hypothetical protein